MEGVGAATLCELPRGNDAKFPGVALPDSEEDGALTEDMDEFELVERVYWLNRVDDSFSLPLFLESTNIPKSAETLAEHNFVDPDLLHRLKQTKAAVFERYDVDALYRARYYANRCELVGCGPFMNRAAVKMANIDARTEFMFSRPLDLVQDDDVLCFADICSGPGGFSEYLLWRRGWLSRGFGITLRGDNDFRLDEVAATLSALNFSTHYGVGGMDGDGDVYRDDNQQEFSRYVLKNTDGRGVHVVMADGGFDVTGNEAMQEVLCSRLYLCQFLLALCLLRPGGHFVCKMFDVFTDFSAGLLFLISLAFDNTGFIKPNTSRPGNSERYLVCKSRRHDIAALRDYLRRVNLQLSRDGDDNGAAAATLQLVPLDVMRDDARFAHYLTETNNCLAVRQTAALGHMALYSSALHSSTLSSSCARRRKQLQATSRDFCLQAWQLYEAVEEPFNQLHQLPAGQLIKKLGWKNTITQVLKEFGHFSSFSCFDSGKRWCMQYQSATIEKRGAYSYVLPCSRNVSQPTTNHLCLLMGRGHAGDSVWYRNVVGSSSSHASRWQHLSLLLPVATLLIIEPVLTPSSDYRVFHVLDVISLAGDDVTQLNFWQRRRLLQLFLSTAVRCCNSCYHGNSSCPPSCSSCAWLVLKPVVPSQQLCSSSNARLDEMDEKSALHKRCMCELNGVAGYDSEQFRPSTSSGGLIINTASDFSQMWKTAIYWPWSNE